MRLTGDNQQSLIIIIIIILIRVCPLADSYVASAAREARSVAELAATKKEDKYSGAR